MKTMKHTSTTEGNVTTNTLLIHQWKQVFLKAQVRLGLQVQEAYPMTRATRLVSGERGSWGIGRVIGNISGGSKDTEQATECHGR